MSEETTLSQSDDTIPLAEEAPRRLAPPPPPVPPAHPTSATPPALPDLPVARVVEPKAFPVEAMLTFNLPKSPFSGARRVFDKVVLAILKVLRARMPIATDMPTVTSLEPFVISADELSPVEQATAQPELRTLSAMGFRDEVYYLIRNPLVSCDTLLVAMRHPTTHAIARITCLFHRMRKAPTVFVQFFNEYANGDVMLTWPRGLEILPPPGWQPMTCRNQNTPQLWETHQGRLSHRSAGQHVRQIPTQEALLQSLDRLQRTLAEHQLKHKVYLPLNASEIDRLQRIAAAVAPAGQYDGTLSYANAHTDVLTEIAAMQNKKSGWVGGVILLAVSLLAFTAAGLTKDKWDFQYLLILLGVLFVHESGHYVAMRLVGYRNLKMFFIPFFGAAVSGQCYNVAGWKKTLVSLCGPVPGIVVAIPLGILGVVIASKTLVMIAFVALLINALNLLPILPLDGGWVLHHLLFSRNVYLDVLFRILAVAVTAVAGALLGLKYTLYMAIGMGVGIPLAFKTAKIVHQLRREGFRSISHDDQTIPHDIAIPIIERIRAATPRGLTTKATAQQTINIFESLNATPPGIGATAGLLVAHGAAFLAAVVFAIGFAVNMHGGLAALANSRFDQIAEAARPKHPIASTSISATPLAPHTTVPPFTLIATFNQRQAAIAASQSLQLPANATCRLFGDSLLIALPSDDAATRNRLYDALALKTKELFVVPATESVELRISADVSSPADAEAFSKPLLSFLAFPLAERLVAPWDSRHPQAPRDPQALQQTITVFNEIQAAPAAYFHDPRYKALSTKLADARKRGDRTTPNTGMPPEITSLQREVYLDKIDELAAKYPQQSALISTARSLADDLRSRKFRALLVKAAEPLLQTLPAGQANPTGTFSGYCGISHSKFSGTFYLLSPVDSVEQIIPYLEANGLRNLRYSLGQGFPITHDADGLPPEELED